VVVQAIVQGHSGEIMLENSPCCRLGGTSTAARDEKMYASALSRSEVSPLIVTRLRGLFSHLTQLLLESLQRWVGELPSSTIV